MASPAWAAPKSKRPSPSPIPSQQQEAPYLTHLVRHHGQLTLTAADNLGARRPPGPEASTSSLSLRSIESGGGVGMEESSSNTAKKKLKRKKKKKGEVDPGISEAVVNVGKPVTPIDTPPLGVGNGTDNRRLEVPSVIGGGGGNDNEARIGRRRDAPQMETRRSRSRDPPPRLIGIPSISTETISAYTVSFLLSLYRGYCWLDFCSFALVQVVPNTINHLPTFPTQY